MVVDIVIRTIADGLVVLVMLIGTYMLIFRLKQKRFLESYSRILLAGLTTYLIAKLGSVFYQSSARPFEQLATKPGALYLDNPGFPSDHVLFVTAIALAVWFETKNKPVTILLAIFVVIIGIGRVLALVHYPIDVIFGVIFGLVGSLWYINSNNRVRTTKKTLKK